MKNKMMKLATVLMVAVLITTSVVSSTYARYAVGGSGGDSARVAKWGVKVTTSTKGMFATTYKNQEKLDGASAGQTVSVSSSNANENLVAPGTRGSTTISLSGTPEVAVDVKFVMGVQADVKIPKNTAITSTSTLETDYTPVRFTLTDSFGNELGRGTINDIKAAFNNLSKQYAPNTDLTETYTLSWEWATDVNNEADTYLGNVASGSIIDDKTTTGIKFNYSVTVTQID